MINKNLMKLINLLMEVNLYTKHTVMFDYMGHTKGFMVRFFKGGWESYREPTESHTFYLDKEECEERINELYMHYSEILNKDHVAGYDEECGF